MPFLHAARGGLSLTLLAAATAAEPAAPIDAELASLRSQSAELAQRLARLEARTPAAAPALRLIDLSLNIRAAAGGSTVGDEEIGELHAGGHDPQRRGFTFQGAELSLVGAVDPYFRVETHAVLAREEPSGETIVELEEAFARSTALPWALELKAGHYLTEFGRFNPTHPHVWAFLDQPIIIGRVMGADGLRAPGARLLASLPVPWLSEVLFGVQNADGEQSVSFLGASAEEDEHGHGGGPIGGYRASTRDGDPRLMYSARWSNAWDIDDAMVKLGASAAAGPNAGGRDTRTVIVGADLAAKLTHGGGGHDRCWTHLAFEAEVLQRRFATDAYEAVSSGTDLQLGTPDDILTSAPGGTLVDRGLVVQATWGFLPGWVAGLRYEFATGRGESIEIAEDDGGGEEVVALGRAADPTRCDRQRWSPLVAWRPSEFSHIRLQYNYDRSDAIDSPAHSVWLGAEFLIGAHPAHTF